MWLPVTNALAYNETVLIATVKKFIAQVLYLNFLHQGNSNFTHRTLLQNFLGCKFIILSDKLECYLYLN